MRCDLLYHCFRIPNNTNYSSLTKGKMWLILCVIIIKSIHTRDNIFTRRGHM